MPEGGEERAVFIGLKNDAQDSLPKAAEHYSGFHGGTADELERQLDAHVTNDLTGKGKFDEINAPSEQGATGVTSRTTTAGVSKDHTYYKLSDKELEEAGITSKGVDGAETGGTDPVDLVSGQLIAATTDAVRLGVLPLILRRAYASGYANGGLYGPGWASTLDIRLVVDGDGIRFLGDGAQSLDYGVPVGLSIGLPSFPVHGARWPLSRDGEHLRVEDTASGIAWFFPRGGRGRGAAVTGDPRPQRQSDQGAARRGGRSRRACAQRGIRRARPDDRDLCGPARCPAVPGAG